MFPWQFQFLNRLPQVLNLNQSAGFDEMSADGLSVLGPKDKNEHDIAGENENKSRQQIYLEFCD